MATVVPELTPIPNTGLLQLQMILPRLALQNRLPPPLHRLPKELWYPTPRRGPEVRQLLKELQRMNPSPLPTPSSARLLPRNGR